MWVGSLVECVESTHYVFIGFTTRTLQDKKSYEVKNEWKRLHSIRYKFNVALQTIIHKHYQIIRLATYLRTIHDVADFYPPVLCVHFFSLTTYRIEPFREYTVSSSS